MSKALLTGDEAIARGAYEAGVTVAAAYPGTPSTEILENVSRYKEIYSQWACNEKVAMEISSGAAIGGARSLVCMKHVGLNVAADPMFVMGYAGVNGGMVMVTADDPGCHSSQNEQDNRLYAPLAKLALMEPSDSQECKDFVVAAYDISERFDIPVLMRMTTRVCHSKSIVELCDRNEVGVKPYERNTGKYSLMPAAARNLHKKRELSFEAIEEFACNCPYNRVEMGKDKKIGIVTSGISYQYAKEVFGDTVSYLKLGFTHPMPRKLLKDFCAQFENIYVIEEGEPYIENNIKILGFACEGKNRIPICGELDTATVRKAFFGKDTAVGYKTDDEVPARPPVLCAGCPHRGFFFALKKYTKKLVAVGDIGCYGMGVNPPLNGYDVSMCMGSGLSAPIGLSKALEKQGDSRKVLGMVGDSTFFHSGMNSMMDVIHANANVCVCILDNSITAMTGHQENPGTYTDLMGNPAHRIDLEKIVRATDIEPERVRVVDPIDQKALSAAIDAALAVKGPFVIICRRPCALLKDFIKANGSRKCVIDAEKCKGCKACMQVACPSMAFVDGKATIADPANCTGCGLCRQMCKFDAIAKVGE